MKTLHSIVFAIIVSVLFSCTKNENSPIVADQEFTIEENASIGTIVGAVEASDPDEGQIISYEIINDNSDATFQINPLNGILTVSKVDKLNYEENTEFILSVAVNDNFEQDPKESISTVKINVSDINEFSPEIEGENIVFTINENQENGFELGKISATDGDIYQELIYSISSKSDSGFVMIDPSSGILFVNDSSAFDYETRHNITLEVVVSDNHEFATETTATISINILNVLELTDGLVSFYKFEGNADDEYAKFNGVENNVAFVLEDNIGENIVLQCNGIDSYVDLSNSFDYETRTISMRIYVIEASSQGLFYSSDNSSIEFGLTNLSVTEVDSKFELLYNVSNEMKIAIIEKGRWYNIALVVDGFGYKCYLNGELLSTLTFSSYINSYNGIESATLGCSRVLDRNFNGLIDDLRIYNRGLSDAEIGMLHIE